MADESSVVPIWCDVGKNLNAVFLMVSLRHLKRRKTTCEGKLKDVLRIYSDKVTFGDHEDGDDNEAASMRTMHFPASFRVVPRSCSGLSASKGREIQMRLQFNHHNKDHNDALIKKHLKRELNELRNGHHSVCCRMCGSAVLSPDKQFKRVLELPSENWLQLAQDWCCHGTSHLTSVVGTLEPDENDCFIGEHYIKVNPAAAMQDNLQVLEGDELQLLNCSRCSSVLGNVTVEDTNLDILEFINVTSIHLYKHKISIQNCNLLRSYCTETFISSCLISKSQGPVNFRFLVQEPLQNGKTKTYACVLQMVQGCPQDEFSINRLRLAVVFTLKTQGEHRNVVWLFNSNAAVVTNLETKDLHSLSRIDKTGIYSVTKKAKYLRVLKVLYKTKALVGEEEWDHEIAAWRDNPSVQVLTFTKDTCLHLLLLLMKSTSTVAPSLRDMNGFKVGYLKTIDT